VLNRVESRKRGEHERTKCEDALEARSVVWMWIEGRRWGYQISSIGEN